MKHELTEQEWDLIETIRNYKRAYPQGERELRWYAQQVLNELLDEVDY